MSAFEFQPEHDGGLPLETAVFQAVGAASVCWEHLEGTGVFQDRRAKQIGEALLEVIHAQAGVLAEIQAERERQDAKWGQQNHPDGTGDQAHALRPLAAIARFADLANATSGTLAYLATQATDDSAREGRVTWTAILLEEVFEALAEDDPGALRTELIQVAAVAAQWVEAIDRREVNA